MRPTLLPRAALAAACLLAASLVLARPAAAEPAPAPEKPAYQIFLPLLQAQPAEAAPQPEPEAIPQPEPDAGLPDYADFVASVAGDAPASEAGEVRGVYVPGVLALRVVPQPDGNLVYIDNAPDAVTQYQLAAHYGVTGLLAHNNLAGAQFFGLAVGDEVRLVLGSQQDQRYRVTALHRFQALRPTDPYSDFVDLDTGETLSSLEVFQQMYTGGAHVTFQTCIENAGNPAWGRLFVVAEPIAGE